MTRWMVMRSSVPGWRPSAAAAPDASPATSARFGNRAHNGPNRPLSTRCPRYGFRRTGPRIRRDPKGHNVGDARLELTTSAV